MGPTSSSSPLWSAMQTRSQRASMGREAPGTRPVLSSSVLLDRRLGRLGGFGRVGGFDRIVSVVRRFGRLRGSVVTRSSSVSLDRRRGRGARRSTLRPRRQSSAGSPTTRSSGRTWCLRRATPRELLRARRPVGPVGASSLPFHVHLALHVTFPIVRFGPTLIRYQTATQRHSANCAGTQEGVRRPQPARHPATGRRSACSRAGTPRSSVRCRRASE